MMILGGEKNMEQDKKPSGVDTVLGENTSFNGRIESRGTLRIDGRVEGEIVAQDTVIVGPSGVIKANVKAASISVSGQVDGNIHTTEKAELHPTATVNGDIKTKIGSLTVQPGAKINGTLTMKDETAAPTAAPTTAPAPSQPAASNAPSEGQKAGGASEPPSPLQRRK